MSTRNTYPNADADFPEGGKMAASQSAATNSERAEMIFSLWLYPAIGIPYLILGWWGGFGVSFRSGAASAFICGVIIAAIGENLFEQLKDDFSGFRAALKSKGQENLSLFAIPTIAFGFFFWNMYFAVADKTVKHPSVDWVQIVVFVLAAMYALEARFAFTEMDFRLGTTQGPPGQGEDRSAASA